MEKTRRWKVRVELLQHALRAVETMNRARESLDHIVRILAEDEGLQDSIPPPPVEHPARYQPAMDSGMFAKLCRKRFEEAQRDEQRDAVRTLVRRGRDSGALAEADAAALEKEFSER